MAQRVIKPGEPGYAEASEDPHFYRNSGGWLCEYPHGMTETEWNDKIGTPSYEHAKDLPDD